jgi:hypothetical protein
MLVSIDGKKWGEFDIGTGIKAGATETSFGPSQPTMNPASSTSKFSLPMANGRMQRSSTSAKKD